MLYSRTKLERNEARDLVVNETTETGAVSVLIIDDDVTFLELTERRLSREGFLVAVNSEPREVLPLIGSGRYDVVVLDLGMPGVSGEKLLSFIRDMPALSKTRVVIHSSMDEEQAKSIAAEYGAVAVSKSAGIEELAAAIRGAND
jgi:DNA-binding response OmpR family regulator